MPLAGERSGPPACNARECPGFGRTGLDHLSGDAQEHLSKGLDHLTATPGSALFLAEDRSEPSVWRRPGVPWSWLRRGLDHLHATPGSALTLGGQVWTTCLAMPESTLVLAEERSGPPDCNAQECPVLG